MVVRLVVRLVGWLVGWLLGWLVGRRRVVVRWVGGWKVQVAL